MTVRLRRECVLTAAPVPVYNNSLRNSSWPCGLVDESKWSCGREQERTVNHSNVRYSDEWHLTSLVLWLYFPGSRQESKSRVGRGKTESRMRSQLASHISLFPGGSSAAWTVHSPASSGGSGHLMLLPTRQSVTGHKYGSEGGGTGMGHFPAQGEQFSCEGYNTWSDWGMH